MSQKTSYEIFGEYNILDVMQSGESSYYATHTELFEIDTSGQASVIDSRDVFQHTTYGCFKKLTSDWAYIGWLYIQHDFISPHLVFYHHKNGFLYKKTILMPDSLITPIQVKIKPNLELEILHTNANKSYLISMDTSGNVLNSQVLDIPDLEQFFLLNNNDRIFINKNEIYNFNGIDLNLKKQFSDNIIDLTINDTNEYFDLITTDSMYRYDFNLELIHSKVIPEEIHTITNISSSENKIFLITDETDYNNIYTIDNTNNQITLYEEENGIEYNNMKLVNNNIIAWGNANCSGHGSILKHRNITDNFQMITIDLSIEDLDIVLVKTTLDSIIFPDGSYKYDSIKHFDWSATIKNNSELDLDKIKITSNLYDHPWLYKNHIDKTFFIDFKANQETEISGQILTDWEFFTTFILDVSGQYLDSNCSNNSHRILNILNAVKETHKTNNKLVIYPNPINNSFNIETKTDGVLIIRNSIGKQIKTFYIDDQINEISDINWEKGLYFMTLYNSEGKRLATQKILKF